MNRFGQIFKVTIFGESHGQGLGIVIDGAPAGIPLALEDFIKDLARRKSTGQQGMTKRQEEDMPQLLSGVFNGYTTGSPIAILFCNKDVRSIDYDHLKALPRPGHADFVAAKKFKGFSDPRGSGHFSGRLTVGLVAAGVLAKKMIAPMEISAQILEIGGQRDYQQILQTVVASGDSVGGLIECCVSCVPAGMGEPFFDSVESIISHAIFSIPAIKGIEFGAGFKAASMLGSEHNDTFIDASGKTATNYSGGINGGITNSNDIVFKVAIKPPSSIGRDQQTINLRTGQMETLAVKGRHDACIALRMPVIIEAATAIALADLSLIRLAKG